jgi:hypothetical protein
MFKRISVLVPTRKRLKRLDTLLESFERTASVESAELVFRVDIDDVETLKRLEGHWIHVGPRLKGYGSMPQFFNEMAELASGDVLMCGNDDMVFRTPGWADRLLAVANRYPDGLFNLGVKTLNETHFPFSTVSKTVVQKLGFLWDPRIFWGDMYLRDVMACFGRCVMVPDVVIDHDWAGNAPDSVYYETLSAKAKVEGSESYWSGPHADAVADAVRRLSC